MEVAAIPSAQAKLKLTILSKQAEAKNNWEFVSEMKDFGFPDEVVEILQKVLKVTSKVAGKAVSIGKIVVLELLKYVAKHPLQVVGLAAGLYTTYALGVAVHGLFAAAPGLAHVPIVGWLLSKLALLSGSLCKAAVTPFMMAAPVVGAVAGEIFDSKFPAVSKSLQKVAKDFFELLGEIINAIKNELDFSDSEQAFA